MRLHVAGEDSGDRQAARLTSSPSRSEATEDEYHEFYKHRWQALEAIRPRVEGTFGYQALLFLPPRAPMDVQRDGAGIAADQADPGAEP